MSVPTMVPSPASVFGFMLSKFPGVEARRSACISSAEQRNALHPDLDQDLTPFSDDTNRRASDLAVLAPGRLPSTLVRLFKRGHPVHTIFDLIGKGEDDMTAALGFVLASSPALLTEFVSNVSNAPVEPSAATIRLQTAEKGEGITDIEIELPGKLSVVIEAKKGTHVPTQTQLAKYAPRLTKHGSPERRLVSVSHATQAFATQALPPTVDGVPVVHYSWRTVWGWTEKARCESRGTEARVLREFAQYLKELVQMDVKYSNLVYVVSLSSATPPSWNLSWIDIVEKANRYFYPVGKSWPDPPNYLGFRYAGRLQSIRHVERVELFTNPRDVFGADAPDATWDQHYCFDLGVPIIPSREVRTGTRIRHAARCWCMLDTLLTSATISDALTETERRRQEA